MAEATASLLHDIEHHCNNFFNPRNDPADPMRNYPEAFLDLAVRIQAFYDKQGAVDRNVTSVSEAGRSVHFDPDVGAWQTVFARELSIWKRAKFI